jgi:hypothetical protein
MCRRILLLEFCQYFEIQINWLDYTTTAGITQRMLTERCGYFQYLTSWVMYQQSANQEHSILHLIVQTTQWPEEDPFPNLRKTLDFIRPRVKQGANYHTLFKSTVIVKLCIYIHSLRCKILKKMRVLKVLQRCMWGFSSFGRWWRQYVPSTGRGNAHTTTKRHIPEDRNPEITDTLIMLYVYFKIWPGWWQEGRTLVEKWGKECSNKEKKKWKMRGTKKWKMTKN